MVIASAPQGAAAPRLRVNGITVAFGGRVVLEGLTLDVPARQVVGLVGANGAGKTTLLDVVCGRTEPAAGRLELDGQPLRAKPRTLARLGIARTFQGLDLPKDERVIDHVLGGAVPAPRTGLGAALRALPARDSGGAARDHALQLLKELGLAGTAETLIGTLPRAAQVRVAIARATVTNPRLLLLDEPAAGLGQEERRELAALIRQLSRRPGRDCSVLVVEHHLDLIDQCCDAVVDLGGG